MSRVDFPEREEIAGEAGAIHLPDKTSESLEDFLKSGVDEIENAQDELEGL